MTHSNRDSSRHNEALKNAFAAYLALIFNCIKLMFLSTFYAPPLWRAQCCTAVCEARTRHHYEFHHRFFNGCRAGEKLLIFGCPNEKKGNLKKLLSNDKFTQWPELNANIYQARIFRLHSVIKWRFSILHEHNIWTQHDSEAWMVRIWP